MSYSRSSDITKEEYRKLIPKFLKLLATYGYAQAQILSALKFQKGDTEETFSNLSVKEAQDKFNREKFLSGKVVIQHHSKEIKLSRSQYTHDLTFELNFVPDAKLKSELDLLFPKKKKFSAVEEADRSKKSSLEEMARDMVEKKKKGSKK